MKKTLLLLLMLCVSLSLFGCVVATPEQRAMYIDTLILECADFDAQAIALARHEYDDLPKRAKDLVQNYEILDFLETVEIQRYMLYFSTRVPETAGSHRDTWYYLPSSASDLLDNYDYLVFGDTDIQVIVTAFAENHQVFTAAITIDREIVNQQSHLYHYEDHELHITPHWTPGGDDQIELCFVLMMFIVKTDHEITLTHAALPEIPDLSDLIPYTPS